jgi:integrase
MSIFKRTTKNKRTGKKSGNYWFHFWFNSRHIQRSTRQSNKNIARQMEAKCRTDLAKGEFGIREPKRVPNFSDAMRDFLAWSRTEHASHPRTHQRYVTSSIALLRYFKNQPLDAITAEDVENYKAERALTRSQKTRRRLRPATTNRELACAKAVFNFAIKSGLPLQNPFSKIKFLDEQNEQTRVLTYTEQQKYLAEASQPLQDVAVLMLETGMRPEEVYRIERENIHLGEGYLFNPIGKTKAAKRKITLTTTAADVLRARLTSAKGRYLFPHEKDADKPMLKVNNAHSGAVRRSNLRYFRLYDLRHTWATRAAMSGIDLVTLAAMLGHSRIQMVLRYAHPTEQHQAQAMRKLEEFNAAKQMAEFEATQRRSLQISLQ